MLVHHKQIPRDSFDYFPGLIKALMPNSDLKILLCLTPDDFTLSKARRFYSSKGDPLGTKGLITISFNPLMPNSDL